MTDHIDAHFTYPCREPYTMRMIRPISVDTGAVIVLEVSATTRVAGGSRGDISVSKGLLDTRELRTKTTRGPCFLRFDAKTGIQVDGAQGWVLSQESLVTIRNLLMEEKRAKSPDEA